MALDAGSIVPAIRSLLSADGPSVTVLFLSDSNLTRLTARVGWQFFIDQHHASLDRFIVVPDGRQDLLACHFSGLGLLFAFTITITLGLQSVRHRQTGPSYLFVE